MFTLEVARSNLNNCLNQRNVLSRVLSWEKVSMLHMLHTSCSTDTQRRIFIHDCQYLSTWQSCSPTFVSQMSRGCECKPSPKVKQMQHYRSKLWIFGWEQFSSKSWHPLSCLISLCLLLADTPGLSVIHCWISNCVISIVITCFGTVWPFWCWCAVKLREHSHSHQLCNSQISRLFLQPKCMLCW